MKFTTLVIKHDVCKVRQMEQQCVCDVVSARQRKKGNPVEGRLKLHQSPHICDWKNIAKQ